MEQLREQTRKGIDISLVINNAGMAKGGPFFEIEPKYLNEMVLCNFKSRHAINK